MQGYYAVSSGELLLVPISHPWGLGNRLRVWWSESEVHDATIIAQTDVEVPKRRFNPTGNVTAVHEFDYLFAYDNGDTEWLSAGDKWPGPDPATGKVMVNPVDCKYIRIMKIVGKETY